MWDGNDVMCYKCAHLLPLRYNDPRKELHSNKFCAADIGTCTAKGRPCLDITPIGKDERIGLQN